MQRAPAEPAKYTMFPGWRACQQPRRTMQMKCPFHPSVRQLLSVSVPAPLRQSRAQEEGSGHGPLGVPSFRTRPDFNI